MSRVRYTLLAVTQYISAVLESHVRYTFISSHTLYKFCVREPSPLYSTFISSHTLYKCCVRVMFDARSVTVLLAVTHTIEVHANRFKPSHCSCYITTLVDATVYRCCVLRQNNVIVLSLSLHFTAMQHIYMYVGF